MAKVGQREFYTVSEAARVLDVSPSTVWRWINAGQLSAHRIGQRTIRIKKEDLENIMRPARATKELTMTKERVLIRPPTQEELARRQALVAKILAKAEKRIIAPMTTADLVREEREERKRAYERWAR